MLGFILLVVLVSVGFIILRKYDPYPIKAVKVKEVKEDVLLRQKDFITYEDRIERELGEMEFNEGYQDDPEFGRLLEKVRQTAIRNKKIEADRLKEAEQNDDNMR